MKGESSSDDDSSSNDSSNDDSYSDSARSASSRDATSNRGEATDVNGNHVNGNEGLGNEGLGNEGFGNKRFGNRGYGDRSFENMATVLVNPDVLDDFELDLMSNDFRVWTVHTVSTFPDAPQAAMQIRRSLIDWSNGRWSRAADWTVVWITFGESWLDGDNPIPWPAHSALWNKLAEYAEDVRYNVGLGGVPRLGVPREAH